MPPSTFMYGFKPITKEPEVLTTPKPQKQYGGAGQRPSPKKVPQKSKYNSNSYRLIIAFFYSSLNVLDVHKSKLNFKINESIRDTFEIKI